MLNYSFLLDRLNKHDQNRIEDIILRIISCMGDLVWTIPHENPLDNLAVVLKQNDSYETANQLMNPKEQHQQSVGKLNSQETRGRK